MTKNELKSKQWSVVELRNGKMYLLLNSVLYSIDSDIKSCINLIHYSDDLCFRGDKNSIVIKDIRRDILNFKFIKEDFDIMKINCRNIYMNLPLSYDDNFFWRRDKSLTEFEKNLLHDVSRTFNYIVRDRNNNLFLYQDKPSKNTTEWNGLFWRDFSLFNHLFKIVVWSDSKPYSIEELLKRGDNK